MTKNIVLCCDGTGNEIERDLSNVLKLFRIVRKNDEQIVYYHPGVGTLSSDDAWSHFKNNFYLVLGLVTGYGLDANVLDAYRFLVDHYEDGDRIYLFGFSRGAYTVRVLAGFLHLVGLVKPAQRNLSDYALTAYKRAAAKDDFKIAWRFERVMTTRRVPIRFIGVWDTVSSVIVPRPDRFYIPSLEELPYTKTNPSVEVFRHALAIDERRRMFRANLWREPQEFKPNPFGDARPQDVEQVWFAGVHSDVGGGYAEEESGAAKYPLAWILDEAVEHGLAINRAMYNHLVLGKPRKGGTRTYAAPSPTAKLHDSMNWGWRILEWLPKRATRKEWPERRSFLGFYLPRSEPRPIEAGALVHYSVAERQNLDPSYAPINLPPLERVTIEGSGPGLRDGGADAADDADVADDADADDDALAGADDGADEELT
ncbi:MAG TPA: DUF2235 domain-containing protein [Gammaproteobacteria bacterium]|nr:DUF2235 domain-containing protein [Gammaproteobacteria bacterium]